MENIKIELIRSEKFMTAFEQAVLEEIREYNTSKSVRHPNWNKWMKMYAGLTGNSKKLG